MRQRYPSGQALAAGHSRATLGIDAAPAGGHRGPVPSRRGTRCAGGRASRQRRRATGRPRQPASDFRGEKRSNATHASTTDPESRLAKKGKGKEARLSFAAHALMENRHGLLVDFLVTTATGTAERETAPVMLDQARARGFHPRTVGADKQYDTAEFVAGMRARKITPHVAQNTTNRASAIDGRTTSWYG